METQKFNELPINEKAILVAKDVMAQIEAKKYIPETGTYLRVIDGFNFEGSIKENFNEIKECKVCALGSMLMSSTHLGNLLTTQDLPTYPDAYDLKASDKITELFNSIFTQKQLLLIETAFEGYSNFHWYTPEEIQNLHEDFNYNEGSDRYSSEELTFEETFACEMFKRQYDDDDVRLKTICQNIIENNGTFNP